MWNFMKVRAEGVELIHAVRQRLADRHDEASSRSKNHIIYAVYFKIQQTGSINTSKNIRSMTKFAFRALL
jgi:hypothetical protein